MRIKARAKVNWTLSVLGQRGDGYHELDMLMQSIQLSDTLNIKEAGELSLALDGQAQVPSDGANLVLKAASLLREITNTKRGAQIRLKKAIPVSAGLGGGSADAAAALVGLNRLWGLGLSEKDLAALALKVGADVPFCLIGGLARARGVGDVLAPLQCRTGFHLVIVKPTIGLSTPAVFAAYDAMPHKPRGPAPDAATRAVTEGDASALAGAMGNALQPAAILLRPEIAVCIQALEHMGALRAQMTGSGSAVIGLYATPDAAARATAACRRIWRQCFCTRTVDHGISIT